MLSNEIIVDEFERVKSVVHQSVIGLSIEELAFRPNKSANSIAWLVWHLTRIQDNHISDLCKEEQIWATKWFDKFALPINKLSTGYGHRSTDVAKVKANEKLLVGYYDDVHKRTIKYVRGLTDSDYHKIVDKRWDPPVTLAIRIVSVLSDDLQHAGQAAYIRGLINND